jgi:hypothetical protein
LLCAGCAAITSDVLVPAEAVGRDGAPIGYCWLCAHLVTAHDERLDTASFAAIERSCECPRSEVYPHREFPAGQGERPMSQGPTDWHDEDAHADDEFAAWSRGQRAELDAARARDLLRTPPPKMTRARANQAQARANASRSTASRRLGAR